MNEYRSIAAEPQGLSARAARMMRESGTIRSIRREAGSWPFLFFMTTVMVIAAIYYLVLAAPLYVSEVKFAIRGRQVASPSPLLAAMTGGALSGSSDSPAVQTYIASQDMLAKLDNTLHLRENYSKFRPDPLYHLDRNANDYRFLRFYAGMVKIDLDSTSNIMSLHVHAFDPVMARNTARAVLKFSSDFIDNLSLQMQNEATRAAENDYNKAKAESIRLRLVLAKFQSGAGNLNPQALGVTGSTAIFNLETSIATLRTQLASLLTYSTRSAPQVKQLEAQIGSLQQQITEQKKLLVDQQNGSAVVNQLNTYQGLVLQQGYADQRVTATQAVLDQALSTAAQKQEFIVPITGPNLPDAPAPRAAWGMLTVFVVAAFIYAIARLSLAGIRDHRA